MPESYRLEVSASMLDETILDICAEEDCGGANGEMAEEESKQG